jgi:4'-phosphopantetheinyl transferase
MDDEAGQACLVLLSEDERARWQRFKFGQHRREYLATHALARIALSHHYPTTPEAWRFKSTDYGKPEIEPDCGVRFNLSNSLGLVVCLISNGAEVGVDVEARDRARSIAEVGPRMFSPQELAQLESLDEGERPGRALHLWTLKEAYIKARGMGLALALNKFSFLFQGQSSIRLEVDPSLGDELEHWRFCLLEDAGHCIALMVENKGALDLNVWETRLPVGKPNRLELTQGRWHPDK